MVSVWIFFPLLTFLCEFSMALVRDVTIINDGRRLFKMETFGFVSGGLFCIWSIETDSYTVLYWWKAQYFPGTINIQIFDFRLDKTGVLSKAPYRMNFIMKKSNTESGAQRDIEEALEVLFRPHGYYQFALVCKDLVNSFIKLRMYFRFTFYMQLDSGWNLYFG